MFRLYYIIIDINHKMYKVYIIYIIRNLNILSRFKLKYNLQSTWKYK